MGSAFHQLCPRYSGTLTPTAPTAIKLWDTFTFTFLVKHICTSFLLTKLERQNKMEYQVTDFGKRRKEKG